MEEGQQPQPHVLAPSPYKLLASAPHSLFGFSAMHSELLPVLKYRDGELQEVSFITGLSSAPKPTRVRVCLACCFLTVGLA
jgi:hypothetical protein